MGKRKNEQPPGADSKCRVPKTKQSLWEGLDATGDTSSDVTGPAQTNDADRQPKSRGQMSAAASAPRSTDGAREAAAAEQSQAGERVPSPAPQAGRDTGGGGGGLSPEAAAQGAASQPASPQWACSMVDETVEDQPAATTERHGSAGEELAAETPTCCRTGGVGDGPERGSAPPARGEGAAGREVALPVDTPGRSTGSCLPAELPDPHSEEEVHHSEPGERRSDAHPSQEPPGASVVIAKETESGTVPEGAAGGEHQGNGRREQPQATGTDEAAENTADSWCCPASSNISAEVLAETKAEGGTAEPESAGDAGTISPASHPQGGNASPWKTLGEADVRREEAGGGEMAAAGTSSALDPAVPAGRDPSGEGEGEGVVEERGAGPMVSGGGGVAKSMPAGMATPGPAPTGTARPPASGTGSAVGAEPRDKPLSPRSELQSGLEGHSLALPPQQPLSAADRCDPAAPGCELRAMASQSRAEEAPLLAKEDSSAQPPPRGEEPAGPHPPASSEDATDVICGLILELSNLNRLAMSAHRGLEVLRRPKPRRSRRPATGTIPPPAGRRWKET